MWRHWTRCFGSTVVDETKISDAVRANARVWGGKGICWKGSNTQVGVTHTLDSDRQGKGQRGRANKEENKPVKSDSLLTGHEGQQPKVTDSVGTSRYSTTAVAVVAVADNERARGRQRGGGGVGGGAGDAYRPMHPRARCITTSHALLPPPNSRPTGAPRPHNNIQCVS